MTATPQWAATWRLPTDSDGGSAVLWAIKHLGLGGYALVWTLAFVVVVALFVTLYAAACAAGARLVRPRQRRAAPSVGAFVDRFTPSLVPIGIGYHLAHYFPHLLIRGQRLASQLSDPEFWGQ